MKIGIAGYGAVGQAINELLIKTNAFIAIYDPKYRGVDDSSLIEGPLDFLFVCVPTLAKEDGKCDTSIVEEVIREHDAEVYVIRSTVWVGFTEWLAKKTNKRVVFMPEYGPSEFENHPFNNIAKIDWAILGGDRADTDKVARLWQDILYNVKIIHTASKTAELVKLVENAYFFNKLVFLNQIYDICKSYKIKYDDVRTMLTEDPRIEADHSFIHPDRRKIGGKCLPKDMSNLIQGVKNTDGVSTELFELLTKLNNEQT